MQTQTPCSDHIETKGLIYFARMLDKIRLKGRKPNDEEIAIWNAFLSKRGWRDDASTDLQAAKERSGFGDREDIQTWIDLHDAEEGRTPATLFSH